MTEMKISIITATFNSAKTLRDTFDSVLRQDYSNYEIIVKDGGSTDDTLSICREYEQKLAALPLTTEGDRPQMKIITTPDQGLYDAMNQGIAAASGEVVGILNSDDFFSATDILSSVNREFEANPEIDALYGDIHYVDAHNTNHVVRHYSSKEFRRWEMRLGFMPAHPSFYCRKTTYERFRLDGREIEGFKGNPDFAFFNTTYKIAADFENLLRMIFVGKIKTHYLHRDFVTMRTGGASSSGFASHTQINRDHMRAFRENGVYSNYLLISLRYCCKVKDLVKSKIKS